MADKAIVDMLFEPLLHTIRNAIDHGAESEAKRASIGKSPAATIRLRARRERENVIVEVEDDGRGIDPDHIRKIARDRRFLAPDVLADMSDREVIDLIFAPGFSTAQEITDLSGRGVGLDAVRTAVERIGGRVFVESDPGVGCTIGFVLPFSAMVTKVITVVAGGQIFGVPIDAVIETLRLPRKHIYPVGGASAFILRDKTIPLMELRRSLGLATDVAPKVATIVVARCGGAPVGFEVDALGESLDVMLKPPEGLIAQARSIAGTTLLGDGTVLLILDLHELIQSS